MSYAAQVARTTLPVVHKAVDIGSKATDVFGLAMTKTMPTVVKNTARATADVGFGLVGGTQHATQQMKIIGNVGEKLGYVGAGFSAFESGKALAEKKYDVAVVKAVEASSPWVPGASGTASITESGTRSVREFQKGDYVAGTLYGLQTTGKAAAGGLGAIYAGAAGCLGGPAGCAAGAAKGYDAAVGGYDLVLMGAQSDAVGRIGARGVDWVDRTGDRISDNRLFRSATEWVTHRDENERRAQQIDDRVQQLQRARTGQP